MRREHIIDAIKTGLSSLEAGVLINALILPKREWGRVQEPGSGHTRLNTTKH